MSDFNPNTSFCFTDASYSVKQNKGRIDYVAAQLQPLAQNNIPNPRRLFVLSLQSWIKPEFDEVEMEIRFPLEGLPFRFSLTSLLSGVMQYRNRTWDAQKYIRYIPEFLDKNTFVLRLIVRIPRCGRRKFERPLVFTIQISDNITTSTTSSPSSYYFYYLQNTNNSSNPKTSYLSVSNNDYQPSMENSSNNSTWAIIPANSDSSTNTQFFIMCGPTYDNGNFLDGSHCCGGGGDCTYSQYYNDPCMLHFFNTKCQVCPSCANPNSYGVCPDNFSFLLCDNSVNPPTTTPLLASQISSNTQYALINNVTQQYIVAETQEKTCNGILNVWGPSQTYSKPSSGTFPSNGNWIVGNLYSSNPNYTPPTCCSNSAGNTGDSLNTVLTACLL